MILSNIKEKERCKIEQVMCSEYLTKRLDAFGISKGTTITVNKIAPFKGAILINVENSNIAIRREIAKQIKVEII